MQKNLIYILLILFLLPSLSIEAAQDKKKDKKKEIVLPHTPQPDPFIQIHTDTKLKESPVANSSGMSKNINTIIEGIDVSHYQGTIDWSAVAATKSIGYAFVKASESNYFVDDYYQYNMSQGRKNGITMGSYHFFRANVSMEEQFKHMISVIDPANQDIVPMIDVEAANGVSPETFARRLKDFMEMVEAYYGRPPILYTYVNFYNKYIAYRGFERYPLMIAFYNEATPYVTDGNKYVMWQYSSRGHVDGIKGNVDRSRFMNGFTIHDVLY